MENTREKRVYPELPPQGEQFEIFDPLVDDAYAVIHDIFVTTPDGQVFPWAADDENYRYAVFTSDACKILQFLYEARSDPRAREILITKGPAILKTIAAEQYLPSQTPKIWKDPLHYRQRRKRERLSNAEPGQFPHEQRKAVFAEGIVADAAALERLGKLALVRGGTIDKMVDYGRVDSVALFMNTYEMLTDVLGNDRDSELYTPFTHATGVQRTLQEAMLDAGRWMVKRINSSDLGLIETLRAFPGDKRNKSWKDSLTALIHPTGDLANTQREVAAIEVQSEYEHALLVYAHLLEDYGRHEEARECHYMRTDMHGRIVHRFWAKGEETGPGLRQMDHFVVAVDRDDQGQPRLVQTPGGTISSFNRYGMYGGDLDYVYADAALRDTFAKEAMTKIGVRSRSLLYAKYPGFVDIQGSYAVWASENADIGIAAYRTKAYTAFAELAVRVLAGMHVSGSLREYNICDDQERLLLPEGEVESDGPTLSIRAEAYAQRRQGFAAAGVIALHALLKKIGPNLAYDYMQRRKGNYIHTAWELQPWWVAHRERAILAEIPSYRFRPEDLVAAISRSVAVYRKEQIPMNDAYEPDLPALMAEIEGETRSLV